MDQVQWTTPNKNQFKCHSSVLKSPIIHKTPVRQNEIRYRQSTYQNSMGGITVLPSHITPPSGLTKFIARNPFESDLTNRLHLSMISPTVFNQVSNSSRDSCGFAWSVEDLALLHPARIDESPMQQIHCTDPEIELEAQAAINKFFNAPQIIPSPWDAKRKESTKILNCNSPTCPVDNLNTTTESQKSKNECWTQTILSLPPKLPKEVEDVLKGYFTFTQEQNMENEEANSSNSSLRRKLFFNHDDYAEDDDASSISLSSVKSSDSNGIICSPLQSGMRIDGSLVGRCSQKMQRNSPIPNSGNISPPNLSPINDNSEARSKQGTPLALLRSISPLNMSPISNNASNMSCQSIKYRPRSVTRLDFTADMSIENSICEENKIIRAHKIDPSILTVKTSLSTSVVTAVEEPIQVQNDGKISNSQLDAKSTKTNDTVEMVTLSEETTPVKKNLEHKNRVTVDQNFEIVNRLKFAADWYKSHSNESCTFQHSNTFSGTSAQQSTSNIAQDTGYQTNSTYNTTSLIDSCSITPVKQKGYWDERGLPCDDDMQLSDWKKNSKHIFSSTPSKYVRRRDH
ncbi:protein aurora borealis [Cephus cinctus]|uniref:Protein aurora borealis n=1 Tax=Cephus cinctus TaxID=211228 RepID=A0AAJ7C3W0_CEPCN|nr:protein aurora borealis [Cephus cinctus]XP_015601358.1 protein aurora borealis [Cephus cinctus]XP_015601359.1 protein aurora borealis [Cephus cinctus]